MSNWPNFGGTTGQPIPGPNQVPESLASGHIAAGYMSPGLAENNVYVSPDGDDDNDGTSWQTAVEHGYVGYAKLVLVGGGYLHCANETVWGGPITGQGAWFRKDGLTISGWQVAVPCEIIGYGPGSINGFQQAGTGILYAGSNDAADHRRKPAQWTAYNDQPVVFRNIETRPVPGHADGVTGNYQAFRNGWDYPRNNDGSILSLAVTSSERTGDVMDGVTEHAVTLTPAIAVTSASRTANITTLVIPRPGTVRNPPWRGGTKIYFDSSSVDFPDMATAITSMAGAVFDDAFWTFSYPDVGPNVASTPTPGTVRSIIVCPQDLIDLESTDAEFPSTQYLVTDTEITGPSTGIITVRDNYGGYAGTSADAGPTANIGNLLPQVRGWNAVLRPWFKGCTSRASNSTSKIYRQGPMFDFGGALAFVGRMDDCYMQGMYFDSSDNAPYDPLRMCAGLCYGDGVAASGLIANNINGQNATFAVSIGLTQSEFRWNRGTLNAVLGSGECPPAYTILGDYSSFVDINDVFIADHAPGFGQDLDSITGIPGVNVTGNCIRGSELGTAGTTRGFSALSTRTFTPWEIDTVATWADLKITGKHPAAWRQISPTGRRFLGRALAPAAWTPVPPSTGIADPMGGTGAVRYDSTINNPGYGKSGGRIIPPGVDAEITFSAGGRYVVCGWFNRTGGTFDPAGLIQWRGVGGADVVWQSSGSATWYGFPPFPGEGWQWIVFHDVVVSASASQEYEINYFGPLSGGTIDTFGVDAFYIPASVKNSDAMEYIGTLRANPPYLPPGMAGTFENQKFIAHGGLGTAKHYDVGADPGEIIVGSPNGNAIEFFDEDGNSIGVLELSSFTVNP